MSGLRFLREMRRERGSQVEPQGMPWLKRQRKRGNSKRKRNIKIQEKIRLLGSLGRKGKRKQKGGGQQLWTPGKWREAMLRKGYGKLRGETGHPWHLSVGSKERLKKAHKEETGEHGPIRGEKGSKWVLSLEKEERSLAILMCRKYFLKLSDIRVDRAI